MCVGEVVGEGLSPLLCISTFAAEPTVAHAACMDVPGGGGLCSCDGEVVWDWAGVVYSEELSEFSPPLLGLNCRMVVCIALRASKVEVRGSPSSSSPALVMASRMAERGWIDCFMAGVRVRDLRREERMVCMMEASRPKSMCRGFHSTTGWDSGCGDYKGRGGGGGEGQ